MYDIFFISFGESNQEANWARLIEVHPNAKRLHGIKGIDKVHLACDTLSDTDWFWTVDGDNYLIKSLEWNTEFAYPDLFMFYAIDPLTEQKTKLGGVKLWRKGKIINRDMSKGDFCLNATKDKDSPDMAFSITRYNATAYEAWKTSFRHCVKLMSPIIDGRPLSRDRENYLDHWKNTRFIDNGRNNARWAHQGYLDAEEFISSASNVLSINDYDFLKKYFKEKHS
jgi:hypothetical protein